MPTIQLFGIPRIAGPGRADLPLSAREAGLLVWLHLEGPSPRARIAGLLWPGAMSHRHAPICARPWCA
jgi:hypothetical protein